VLNVPLLTCIAACFFVGAAVGGSSSRPALTLVDPEPLTVRGMQFKAGEVVLVRAILRSGPRLSKSVTTGARGGFTAKFQSAEVDACSSYAIRATGSRGSRAFLTVHPPPCGPSP